MKHIYLYGKNSVLERIKLRPKTIHEIFLDKKFSDKPILDAIHKAGLPVKEVSEQELSRIKRADRLQGIVARVDQYQYTDFEELLFSDKAKDLTFIFLDRISDPHNLGSIMRIIACLGNFVLVIPRHEACGVNETVLHVASGGENYVPVAVITNMSQALEKAKKQGFWIAGAVVDGGETLHTAKLPKPLCLVLGSEGKGIRPGIAKHLDIKLTLPMKGAPLSLNVAMASAIFCYEINSKLYC